MSQILDDMFRFGHVGFKTLFWSDEKMLMFRKDDKISLMHIPKDQLEAVCGFLAVQLNEIPYEEVDDKIYQFYKELSKLLENLDR